MAYTTSAEVLFWAQMASGDLEVTMTDFDTSITNIIAYASDIIEEYCRVPSGFFDAGGVTITDEYHDGTEVGRNNSYVRFFGVRKTPFLHLKYTPVISVTTVHEETSPGSWTARTEGRANTFLVTENGIRYVRNSPAYDYKNVKVTYVAGYAATPSAVSRVCARLGANMLHHIIDSEDRAQSTNLGPAGISFGADFMGIAKTLLTTELKTLLNPYRRLTPISVH